LNAVKFLFLIDCEVTFAREIKKYIKLEKIWKE
jgi:hypothetical protein